MFKLKQLTTLVFLTVTFVRNWQSLTVNLLFLGGISVLLP